MVENMMSYMVTGTDTDIGKTIVCAWLMLHLKGSYWKPIQAGLDEPTDQQLVQNITQLGDDHFFPSTYRLTQPLSPHEAAYRDNIRIQMSDLQLPVTSRPLIVEGAGGLMVPLNDRDFMIDLMAQFNLPIVLVCRSILGTINHSLLSLKALRDRHIPIAGLVINGPLTAHNREALEYYGKAPVIAEIPHFDSLSPDQLLQIKPEIAL